ncbi:MAG: YhgE/Pip domain-containing protein [Clostridiales bacterium]|nr:YhgE/Pip domain-containing protein [Clostridiales bacterium]
MLQVSLTLNTEKCSDIESPNATIANAGKNKVIVHTVLPGNDASITLKANVQNFTMGGIEMSAMPFSMHIELPDTGSISKDMTSLSNAVSELNNGVKALSEGIEKTFSGASELSDGSSDFAGGLSELSGNSKQVLDASKQIKNALNKIANGLDEGIGDFNMEDIAALPSVLRQLTNGLTEISSGMQTLKEGYAAAYSALDSAISTIPSTEIDPTELYIAVAGAEALTATLNQLVEYYAAAKTVKGTYAAVQEAFASVEGSLNSMGGSIGIIAGTLSQVADEIEKAMIDMDIDEKIQQLESGLSQLSDNYKLFHKGLGEYMNGVKILSNGYSELNSGIQALTGGIGELYTGAADLYKGSSELNDAVAKLPDTIQIELDELIKEYDKSNFSPVSFVSEKNDNVIAVQFVLKTAPIEVPEASEPEVVEPVKLSFWQKLLKLFGLYP